MQTKDLDLLNGPILKKLLIYVFPLMFTNLLQVLYNTADMIVVGMSDVNGAIGAIGITAPLINLLVNLFVGLSIGANVIVARHIGENNTNLIEKSVHTSLVTSVIAGCLCSIAGIIICKPMLRLMGNEGYILDLSSKYATIIFGGVPFLSMVNFLIAIYRAKGDTKTSLIVLSFTGILNVVLNLFFVVVLKKDVDGVAIATVISNAVSVLILAQLLSKDAGPCRLDFKKLSIDKNELKLICVNGLPAGIQGSLFSISNLLIQSSLISVNSILCPGGSAVIDGNAAANSIENFEYTATNSVATAETTFVSQHYGAKKYERMDKVIKISYLFTFTVSVIFAFFLFTFKRALLSLYISDPLAIDVGIKRFIYMTLPYFTLAFMEMGSSTLKGMNKPVVSTVVSLIGSCLFRIIWLSTVFPHNRTVDVIYMSYPISWILTALTHLIFIRRTRRQLTTSDF